MKTVKEIVDLLTEMWNSEDEDIRDHANTLMGPRRRGSITNKPLSAVPELREVFEFDGPAVADGCQCFCFAAPELNGRILAAPLEKVLAAEEIVSIREGLHGPELFVDKVLDEEAGFPAEGISVIIGEFKGQRIIFTWHPGEPMIPFDGKTFTAQTAVKLHNGE